VFGPINTQDSAGSHMTLSDKTKNSSFPLTMASEEETVRIVALTGGKQLELRLTSLGLNVGSEIRIGQKQGGRFVVIRGEARLALGAGMASKINVMRI